MNRHQALALLVILLTLVACSPAAAPKQEPFAPYSGDDNSASHGGDGKGGGEMM